jgi:hypothetical protein
MNETLFGYRKMNTNFKFEKNNNFAPFYFFHATPNINDIRPIHHLGFQVEQIFFESMDPKTLFSICFTYQISINFAIYEHV